MAASSPAVAASPASSGMISEASEALKKAEAAAKADIQDALTSANSQTCDDEDVPVVTTTVGTQDPPPSKLELCQAKLNALQVNERQWLNPVKDSSSQVADIIVDQAAPGAPSTDAFGR